MSREILRAASAAALLAAGLATASQALAYTCEVRIQQVGGDGLTFTTWERTVPDFQSSGVATFDYQTYTGDWGAYVPLAPTVEIIVNTVPSRTQKCMNRAVETVFPHEGAADAIFDEILAREPGPDAKARFCRRPEAMPDAQSSPRAGRALGINFKVRARKVSNRNRFVHEDFEILPSKGYCADFYPPACSLPPTVSTPGVNLAEPDMGLDSFEDIIGGDSAQTMGTDGPTDTSADVSETPEITYCEPLPYTPPVERTFHVWTAGQADWSPTSRGTYGPMDVRIADFTGDGRDDQLPASLAYVYSHIPTPGGVASCVNPSGSAASGMFGGLKVYSACIAAPDRRPAAATLVARQASGGAQLVHVDKTGWSRLSPGTAGWSAPAVVTAKTLRWDPDSGVPEGAKVLPADMADYGRGVAFAASDPAKLVSGDFSGDGTDDALLVHDGRWWVSEDFAGPWVVVADLAHLSALPVIPVGDGGTPADTRGVGGGRKGKVQRKDKGGGKAAARPATPAVGLAQLPAPGPALAAVGSDASALRIADLDGDGRDDVVVADGSAWRVFPSARGRYRTLRASNTGAEAMAFGDVDGDGRDDIVVREGARLVAHDGGREPARDLVRAVGSVADIRVGDFDGDGRDDLLALIE